MTRLAFDRASARTISKSGHMHVSVSNISKACVNPYRGNEIPNFEKLGLNPDRVYQLLRDPAELAMAVDTFNNIPVLDIHVPALSTQFPKDHVIGSTGTDAAFDEPYLRNSLVFWTAEAIAAIDTDTIRELSCSYFYEADMTSGEFQGVKYDGIMRNIKGNHVALVEVGRAGPDVLVGDSQLMEKPRMKLNANARAVKAAITGYLAPLLAADSQMADLTSIVKGVKSVKTAKVRDAIVTKVTAAHAGMLAADADLSGLGVILATLANDEDDEPKAKVADDEDEDDEAKPKVADDNDDKDDKPSQAAMDAAIKLAADQARTEARKDAAALRQAEIEVRPLVGDLAMALDSAAAVYKFALEQSGVELTDVDPSAFRPLVQMAVKNKSAAPAPKMASDSQFNHGSSSAFDAAFPTASKVRVI